MTRSSPRMAPTNSRAGASDLLSSAGLSYATLALGSVAAVVFLLVPAGSVWQLVAWPVPYVLGTVLLAVRVLSGPSSIRAPLALLLAGALLYFGAAVVWYIGPVWLGYELPFPSPLDAIFFMVYVAYAAFLLIVLRRRAAEAFLEGRLALADAGILTVGLSAVVWLAVIEPNLERAMPLLVTATALLYPAFQLLLFALGIRLTISARLWSGGVAVPLLLWLGGELLGDLFYGYQSANGTFTYQGPLMVTWLLSFTGLAAFAAHPGVVDLLQPGGPAAEARGSRMRTAGGWRRWLWHGALLAAALVPLVLALLTPPDDLVLMVVAGVMFALVLYRVSLVSGDLAEQRRLGDELAAAVAQLRAQRDELSALGAAVDATVDAVVTASSDGVILGWNRGAERMYGYPAAEALGQDIAMLMPDDHRYLMAEWAAALEKHGHTSLEREVLRKDGSRLLEEVTISKVHDKKGRGSAVVHIGRDTTQRREMQREVAAHADRLNEAQRIAGVGSWEWKVDTQEVSWSAELRRMFGLSPTAAVSVAVFLDHVLTEDRPEVEERIFEAVDTTGAIDFETRIVRADGQVRWIAVRGETQASEGEGSRRMAGTVQDITERKGLERDLHRISVAVANAMDGIAITDAQERILYVNDARARMHGYEQPAELIGAPFDVLFDATEHSTPRSVIGPALERDGQWRGEFSGRRRDGVTFPMEISRTRLPDGHLISVARDISHRREAERALRQSEERYRLVTRATQEIVWDTDLLSGKSTWRGAVHAMLGFSEDDVDVDSDWLWSQVHPDDKEALFAEVQQFYESDEEMWSREFRLRSQEGRYVPVFSRGYVVRDECGRAVRFVGSLMDISKRKEHEEQLRAAREEAEVANEAKSQFLANMSHEIRTPMNGVLGLAELLLDTELDPVQKDYVETVHRSGAQLLAIINDILDISKIEAGKMPIETADFSVERVLEDATASIALCAVTKGLDLECFIEPVVPRVVTGDSARVRQVLMNLVSNAVKFTEEGHVRVRVELVAETHESVELLFVVEDSGIGLTPEEQSRLFQSFSQADTSTTRRYGGTGLGLAICKELVELMGGALGIASEPRVGSRFWFRLPFGRRDFGGIQRRHNDSRGHPDTVLTATSAVQASAGPADSPPRVDGDAPRASAVRPRVLLVEDSTVNQLVAKGMLAKLGYSVDVAGDGVEALELFTRERYAAILMDVQMPAMDGYEAAAAIRAREERVADEEDAEQLRIPIIAMTANALSGDREKALRSGMDDYLTKPYTRNGVEEVLDRWVDAKHRHGEEAMDEHKKSWRPEQRHMDPLDQKVLEQLRELGQKAGKSLLETIVPAFLEDAHAQVSALHEGLSAEDADAVASIAHKLKGSSANVGALSMADTCSELETLAGHGQLVDGFDLVRVLTTQLASVQTRLEDEITGEAP